MEDLSLLLPLTGNQPMAARLLFCSEQAMRRGNLLECERDLKSVWAKLKRRPNPCTLPSTAPHLPETSHAVHLVSYSSSHSQPFSRSRRSIRRSANQPPGPPVIPARHSSKALQPLRVCSALKGLPAGPIKASLCCYRQATSAAMECLVSGAPQRFCSNHPVISALALALALIGLTRLARFVGTKVLPPVWRGIGGLFLRLFQIGRQLFVRLFRKRRPPVQLPAIPFLLAAAPIGSHLFRQVSPFFPKAISIAPSFLTGLNPFAPLLSSVQSFLLDASQLWAAQPILCSGLLLCAFLGTRQPIIRRTLSGLGSLFVNLVAKPIGRFLQCALGAKIPVPRFVVLGIGLHWILRLGHSTGHLIARLPSVKAGALLKRDARASSSYCGCDHHQETPEEGAEGRWKESGISVVDVTQMNGCEMQRVSMVATEEDVQAVVRAAQLKGCQVSL